MQFHSELSESIFSNIPTSLMYSLSNKQAEQISPSIIREKYSDNQNNFVSLKSITGGNPMQIDVDPSKRKSFELISLKGIVHQFWIYNIFFNILDFDWFSQLFRVRVVLSRWTFYKICFLGTRKKCNIFKVGEQSL